MDGRDYQQTVKNALSAAYAIVRSDIKAGRLGEVDDTAVRTMLVADGTGKLYHIGRMDANIEGLARKQFLENAQVVVAKSQVLRRFGFSG